MSEILIYHVIGILAIIYFVNWLTTVAFNAGVEYGRSKTTPIMNILCEETKSGFMFHELLSKAFICQTNDYSNGVEILAKKFPDKTIIISIRESVEDESV